MVRKWMGVRRKYSVHYLDCSTHDILNEDELEKQGEKSYLRFVLTYDPITSSIIFNFTDYKDKPTLQHVHLTPSKFEFDFYNKDLGVEDNIYYYRMNKLHKFIDRIFWHPTDNDFKFGEITLSSPLDGTKKIFPNLPYPPR